MLQHGVHKGELTAFARLARLKVKQHRTVWSGLVWFGLSGAVRSTKVRMQRAVGVTYPSPEIIYACILILFP